MIRIAICDDDVEFSAKFQKSLEELIDKTNMEVSVKSYSDSLEFFEVFSKNPYDIVFLDIEMSGICGFQMVENLRFVKDNVIIIYVSSHDSYVYRSLVFRPFRFIRKARYEDELYEAFVSAQQLYESESQILNVIYDGEATNVRISDILYFDVYSHSVYMHLNNKKIPVKSSLSELEKKLESVGFIRIHKSYLVNSKHIYFVKSTSVVLDNHSSLPISKHRIKDIKEKMATIFRRSESLV